MRTFLGVLMLLMVSGDDEVTVIGFLEERVLLPCTCLGRNLKKDFQWQREDKKEDKSELVFKSSGNTSDFKDNYKGRAEIFLTQNNSNCSVLLTNITADDQGKYSCRFYEHEIYRYFYVNLSVFASYVFYQHAPVTLSSGVKVFQCDVKGRDPQAEIEWQLDGELLTNSSNISNTYTLDAPTGLYHFNSKLMTELNWTSEPKCVDKAKAAPVTGPGKDRPHTDYFRICFKVIPIVSVLGLSLLLCYQWKVSR